MSEVRTGTSVPCTSTMFQSDAGAQAQRQACQATARQGVRASRGWRYFGREAPLTLYGWEGASSSVGGHNRHSALTPTLTPTRKAR